MGDPTLRIHVMAPPTDLQRKGDVLSWKAAPDPGIGYHVYGAPAEHGPFTRLTEKPIQATTYKTTAAVPMVRAVRRETGPSGTYLNASQGLFLPALH
jgi:hypothetical protein